MTWLGFGYTTGLSAIDYYLCDEELVPDGFEHVGFGDPELEVQVKNFDKTIGFNKATKRT